MPQHPVGRRLLQKLNNTKKPPLSTEGGFFVKRRNVVLWTLFQNILIMQQSMKTNTLGATEGKGATKKTAAVANIAEALKVRGFIQDEGGGEAKVFLAEKRTIYHGIDPTATSLHLGHLVSLFLLKRLADAGHTIIFLVGGGTGMIGDPRASGERVLLDSKTVAKNTKALQAQLATIFGKKKFTIVNNATWLAKLSLIDFLRDTAKHFTVNQLIKREIIKKRLDDENDSISFTEFSYSLLQGYDFWHLFKTKGVDLQIGGSDQWANIISGVDLIRRREGKSAFALTTPIIIDKKTGKKFGKSEGNAVWLDPKQTSPFEFYQFWFNVNDEGLQEYLNIFTFLDSVEIQKVLKEHAVNPSLRVGQKRLALEITTHIHGKEAASAVSRASEILYGTDPLGTLGTVTPKELGRILKEAPVHIVTKKELLKGILLTDILLATGLASSKGEGRRLIEGNGVSVNTIRVTDPALSLGDGSFIKNVLIVRAGKKVSLVSVKG